MIKTWAVTDTGLVRKENQDTYRIARNGDICVVCDGMGGAAGGRLASTLASETYAAEMEKALKPDMTPEQLREASAYAVAMANRAVAERAEAEAALANMGTTLVAAVAYENGVVITNVGDSRAYYITEAGITRITKDHSLVETMVDHGDITADEARRPPGRIRDAPAGLVCPAGAAVCGAPPLKKTTEKQTLSFRPNCAILGAEQHKAGKGAFLLW